MDNETNNKTIVEMFSPLGFRLTVDFSIENLSTKLQRWLDIEDRISKMGFTPFYNHSTAFIPKQSQDSFPAYNHFPNKGFDNVKQNQPDPSPEKVETVDTSSLDIPEDDIITEKQCIIHNAKMKRFEDDKGEEWYSHKIETPHGDKWCQGAWCYLHEEPLRKFTGEGGSSWNSHQHTTLDGVKTWCKGASKD